MNKKTQWIISGILVLVVLLFFFVFKSVVINGNAMEPIYPNGAKYYVNKFSYILSNPTRGDVVTFHYTQSPQYLGIARIIGLPGEKLKISDGKVFVNGIQIQEDYLSSNMMTKTDSKKEIKDISTDTGKIEDVNTPKVIEEGKELTIPENQYFLMGDNRLESIDSRGLGLVDKKDIIGKLAFKY